MIVLGFVVIIYRYYYYYFDDSYTYQKPSSIVNKLQYVFLTFSWTLRGFKIEPISLQSLNLENV